MPTIVASFLLTELAFFLVYDLVKSRRSMSPKLKIRITAGMAGMLLVTMEVMVFRPCGLNCLVADMMLVNGIMVMTPCSFEKPSYAFCAAVIAGAAAVVSNILTGFLPSGSMSFRLQRVVLSYSILIVTLTWYYAAVALRRFKGIRLFFRNIAVWHNIEDYSRFLFLSAYLCLGIMSLCSMSVPGNAGTVLGLITIVLLMVLYAVLFLRSVTGRTFVLDPDTETRVKDIIKGNLRTSFIDKAEEDRKMNNLYRRIMNYMTEEQPYLDPSFCMNDLAEKVYSNKLYLSRTVNILSGRNFRQFVNYHRVQYAMALFRKDPRLKVTEAAELSGFNSAVSFNMAFKVNTGMTPSEWLQEHVRDQGERLASF